jgi:hypothetical protein
MKGLTDSRTPVFGLITSSTLVESQLSKQDTFTSTAARIQELVVTEVSPATKWWSAPVATHYGANLQYLTCTPVLPNPAEEIPDNNQSGPYPQ